MLRQLIDNLSSAVFNRAVRRNGLGAISGWSKVNYGNSGAPSRSPIGYNRRCVFGFLISESINICVQIDSLVETGISNFGAV
jgi:hypothetical protein